MNRITTVLLALLVATQVPNAIEKGSELAFKWKCQAEARKWFDGRKLSSDKPYWDDFRSFEGRCEGHYMP